MYLEAFIEVIVNEVVKRLMNQPKKALVAFTGGSIGFLEGIKEIKRLIEKGWQVKVLLSKSAESVLTRENVKTQLGIEDIYLESQVANESSLYDDVDLLIIPVLTLNTAAKVALCINDSMIPSITSHMIMQGRPIIAAKDACDLNNPTRLALGMNKTPAAYKRRTEEYLSQLEDYGIKLINADDIYNVATNNNPLNIKEENISIIPPVTQVRQDETNFSKKVLSREDIMEVSKSSNSIRISSGTIVTDLAKETARELNIKIVYS